MCFRPQCRISPSNPLFTSLFLLPVAPILSTVTRGVLCFGSQVPLPRADQVFNCFPPFLLSSSLERFDFFHSAIASLPGGRAKWYCPPSRSRFARDLVTLCPFSPFFQRGNGLLFLWFFLSVLRSSVMSQVSSTRS